MKISYIAQPDAQLGNIFLNYLAEQPLPKEMIIVSAFVSLQTLFRLRSSVRKLREGGSVLQLTIGVDLGGTSKEALLEMARWNIPVTIVKNSSVGHTFHPKLYLLRWENKALIIVASSNLTEGGLFRNYEASALIEYNLPDELEAYMRGREELSRFLNPVGTTARVLDQQYLALLLARDDIPSEKDARNRTNETPNSARMKNNNPEVFGSEKIPPPPPMPPEVLAEILASATARQRAQRRSAHTASRILQTADLGLSSFYMTLPKMQGPNIPGESRIPLSAIEMAPEFWGWPHEYHTEKSPRGGEGRVYHNWKPIWRVSSAEDQERTQVLAVRMYMYDNSSDFRFYARPLVDAGGDRGDIVQITRVARPDIEFECVLTKEGSETHREWLRYCTIKIRNSVRMFGYD